MGHSFRGHSALAGLRVGLLAFFPMSADETQAVSTEFEFVAESAEHWRLLGMLPRVGVSTGDEVGFLALFEVAHEGIFPKRGSAGPDRLGIDAGPEEGEVADVAENLSAFFSTMFRPFRLDQHGRDFLKAALGSVLDGVDRISMNEPGQQFGEIIHESRVGEAQF